ncbi:MAG TPA: pitrilysin family protein [Caulobacteraceae bacterium]|jgi:zinc protease
MKRTLIASAAVAALLAAAFPAVARQPEPAAAASGAAGVQVAPLGFQRRTLANGLEVYTLRDTSTSNVTVQVWYKVGAKDDPQGRSGFAHLFEHLMFKATENLEPETFDRLTDDVGGFNNASTWDDFTNYYQTIPGNHAERLLFAEADRMRSLVVDQAIFASERDVVKEEYRLRVLSSPYGRLFRLHAPNLIYEAHPYRRSGIGSMADLDAATIEDVRAFHATYYRPDNAFIIVAGNFEQAQMDAWIDQYFAGIPNPGRPLPVNNVAEPEPTGPRDGIFYAPNVPLPAAMIAWPTVAYRHEDRPALAVLDGILSTGESSRLHRALVYEQQIAAEASSSPDFAQQAGAISAYAIMSEGHTVDEGLAALRTEVARLRDQPVTEAELAEAKNEIIASTLRARETVDDRAFAFGQALVMTGDPEAADREIAQIQAVTVADVQRVARRYLTEARSVTLRYLPADEAHPETPQATGVTAPVTLADLATPGAPVSLRPVAERTPIPAPGTEVAVAVPAIAERTLANGLRVLVAPSRNLPLAAARLTLDAGSSENPANRAGLASTVAAMVSQGAGGLSAPQIATEIEQLGAVVGASASSDASTVYANAPTDVFPRAVALMGQMARSPDFAAEELARQQTQTLDALRLSLSQPGPVAGLAANRAVFGDAPYGAPGSGTLTSIPAITRDDLVAFHRAHWRPSSATLVFSGDIEPEAAFALAEQTFGDWRDPAKPSRAAADPAGPPLPPRVIVIDQPGAGQAAVYVALRGIERGDLEAYYPLTVGSALLGAGGLTTRLSQEIRVKRGLSYGVGFGLGARQDEGITMAQAQTRNDAAVQVAELMLAEMRRMAAEPASAEELAPKKAALIGSFGSALETVDGLGSLVAGYALYGLPMSELRAYTDRIRGVSPEGVQAAFAREVPADQVSLVVVGDAAQFIDTLRAAYPNLELIPMSELNLDRAALR